MFSNKLFKLSVARIIFLLAFIINLGNAFAMLELELTKGTNSSIPIAIFDFQASGDDISKVVKADLHNSGEFNAKNIDEYVENYHSIDSTSMNNIKRQGLEFIVVGSIKHSGSNLQVKYQLIDLFNPNGVIKEKEFSVKTKELRSLAHAISDQVYQQIIGTKGAFSTKMAYIRTEYFGKGKNAYTLEICDYDGYNPQILMKSTEPIMSPTWAPNGRQIAFVSFENKKSEIYVIDIYRGSRKLITSFNGINGAPAWSPDGSKLAIVLSYSSDPQIYIYDLSRNNLNKLTSSNAIDTEPIWDFSGKNIYFTSDRGGSPQIYKIDLGTQKVDRVTYVGKYNASPKITPCGKKLVVLNKDNRSYNLTVIDLVKNELLLLDEDDFINSPSISPNGKMVAYATRNGHEKIIKIISINGKVKLSYNGKNISKPAWSPFNDVY